MPFEDYISTSYAEIAAAETELGHIRQAGFRKVPTQGTANGIWADCAMMAGNPPPMYYASSPLVAAQIKRSTDGGLNHGEGVYPAGKFLKQVLMMNTSTAGNPCGYMLCDYLMYYPFIDMSVTDYQAMTNGVALPRYQTGAGVRMFALVVAPQIGGVTFTVQYTNSDGVAGRVTPAVTCNAQAANGTIIHSHSVNAGCTAGPFIPLQAGDSGVRAIEGVTFQSADVGLITLVLVKPLANLQTLENTAPAEVDYFVNKTASIQIWDDAYLNFLLCGAGTVTTGVLMGMLTTIWSQ